MKTKLVLALVAFALSIPTLATASDPVYSLDSLSQHPYRYQPPAGHAYQNPGSPKWFVPGYGYRIPGFGYSSPIASNMTPYDWQQPRSISMNNRMYWEIGRTPWHLPGSPPAAPFPLDPLAW